MEQKNVCEEISGQKIHTTNAREQKICSGTKGRGTIVLDPRLRPTKGRSHNLHHHQEQLPRRGNINDQPAHPRSKPTRPPPATAPSSLPNPRVPRRPTRTPLNNNFTNPTRRRTTPAPHSTTSTSPPAPAMMKATINTVLTSSSPDVVSPSPCVPSSSLPSTAPDDRQLFLVFGSLF